MKVQQTPYTRSWRRMSRFYCVERLDVVWAHAQFLSDTNCKQIALLLSIISLTLNSPKINKIRWQLLFCFERIILRSVCTFFYSAFSRVPDAVIAPSFPPEHQWSQSWLHLC